MRKHYAGTPALIVKSGGIEPVFALEDKDSSTIVYDARGITQEVETKELSSVNLWVYFYLISLMRQTDYMEQEEE